MAFASTSIFKTSKQVALILALKGFLDAFNIPTTRKVAGVYTVDLIRELQKQIGPLSESQVDAGLDYLIPRLTEIRGK